MKLFTALFTGIGLLFMCVGTGIYFLVGLIGFGLAVYFMILGRNIADASVFISSSELACGNTFSVAVQQMALNPLSIEEAKIGLVCQATTRTKRGSKTSYSTQTRYEELALALENHAARAGERLEYSTQLTIPADQPASSPPGFKDYPRIRWAVRLRTKLKASPDYRTDFPVTITGLATTAR